MKTDAIALTCSLSAQNVAPHRLLAELKATIPPTKMTFVPLLAGNLKERALQVERWCFKAVRRALPGHVCWS